MENGQLEKKVEWLDDERRSALETIAKLEKRIGELEDALDKEREAVKPLHKEVARFEVQLSKMDELEERLAAYKKELQAGFKQASSQQEEARKELKTALEGDQKELRKSIQALEKDLTQFKDIEKPIKALQQGEKQQQDKLAALAKSVDTVLDGEQRRENLVETIKEDRVKDSKQLAEMRGELAAVVKNAEKAIAKVDIVIEDQRKLEKQMDGVDEAQEKMRAQQRDFVEKAEVRRTERQRQWGEWGQRFDQIEKTSEEMKLRLQELGKTDMAVKRAQKSFDDLVEKINRRVNEMNEIQRLGEQRVRQEWSTFQADSQKRWSNFNLGYEEQRQEAKRQREKLTERVTLVEDSLQEAQDRLQNLGEQLEAYFQRMLEMYRETLAENERFFDNFR